MLRHVDPLILHRPVFHFYWTCPLIIRYFLNCEGENTSLLRTGYVPFNIRNCIFIALDYTKQIKDRFVHAHANAPMYTSGLLCFFSFYFQFFDLTISSLFSYFMVKIALFMHKMMSAYQITWKYNKIDLRSAYGLIYRYTSQCLKTVIYVYNKNNSYMSIIRVTPICL